MLSYGLRLGKSSFPISPSRPHVPSLIHFSLRMARGLKAPINSRSDMNILLQAMELNSDAHSKDDIQSQPSVLAGRRLGVLTAGYSTQVTRHGATSKLIYGFRLCLCVFLSALDITIVSTSLTTISNDLRAFDKSSWIVSSYLTTYFSRSPTTLSAPLSHSAIHPPD